MTPPKGRLTHNPLFDGPPPAPANDPENLTRETVLDTPTRETLLALADARGGYMPPKESIGDTMGRPLGRPEYNAISTADGPFYVEASTAPPKPPYGSPARAAHDKAAPKPKAKATQVYLQPAQLDYLRRIEVAATLLDQDVSNSAVVRFALDRLASGLTPEQMVGVLNA